MIRCSINALVLIAPLKNLFFLLTCFLCLSAQTSKSQRKFIHFYRDTVVKCGEYSIATQNTYLRGGMFLKSTVSIYNPTDQYLVLDYRSAYAIGDYGAPVKFCNNEDPTFLPKGWYRQRLKFKPMPNSHSITFHFPRVYVTSKSGFTYEPVDVPKKVEAISKVGNITIQVLKITRSEDQYAIRVRIQYAGDKFLAINFPNICAETETGRKIFNQVRENHRMHHRESKYLEMATLKFPIQEGEKLGNVIHFKNVFSEHSLRDLEGFDLHYTLQAEDGVNAPTEEELKKKEKTEDE